MILPIRSVGKASSGLPERKLLTPISSFLRYWFLLLSILAGGATNAQTTLTAGDVAVVGYNATDPDAVGLVLLTNITAGTSFSVTDNGWLNTGAFRTGEGVLSFTAPTSLSAGTVLTWVNGGTSNSPGFTATTLPSLSGSGDQLIVFTGALTNPTLIYALNTLPWVTTGTLTTNSSYEPTATNGGTLVPGVTTIALPVYGNNAFYSGSTTFASKAAALAAISSAANWVTNGTTAYATSNWYRSAARLFPFGSTWKYLDNGSDQGTAWRASGFNDGIWASGLAPLGYRTTGNNSYPVSTSVSFGPSSTNKYITTYFRTTATLTSLTSYSAVQLRLRVDDGAVVYVNGTEVARTANLPAGTVGFSTTATSTASNDGADTQLFSLAPSAFTEGANTIAVEVHQQAVSSSDIFLDLQLTGLLAPVTPLTLTASAAPTSIVTTGTTTLSAAVSGGTAPYSYTFSGPGTINQSASSASTATVTNLPAGIQSFFVTVTDATNPTSQTLTGTVSVTVTQANRPPVVTNTIPNQTATAGTSFNYIIPANTFSDPDNQTLTLITMGLPSGLTFDSSTSAISGTPTSTGVSTVTVVATDTESLSTSTTFVLSVTALLVAPGATLIATNAAGVASTTLTCTNPTLTLTASATATGGNYTYLLEGPGILTSSPTAGTATVNASGTYSVTVIDGATGQTSTATTVIESNTAAPTATLDNNGPISTGQTSATLTAGTGLGYTYTFSTGATQISTTNQATVTTAGTYTVIVTGTNGCTASASTTVQSNTVAPGNTWSFFDKGVTPPVQGALTWKDPGFVEPTSGTATWGSGPAPLGYGSYPTATTVSFGPSSSNKYITTYFRRVFTFTQEQLAQNFRYKVRYRRDDGIAIYINGALRADGGGTQTGIEVRRENLPTGTLTNTTVATATVGTDDTWYEFYLPNGALRPGTNLIAAEVHQAAANSSDIFFDLELVPESNSNTLAAQALPVTSTASTNWKYWDEGVSLENTNWKALNFNDQYWQQTNTGSRVRMGYGETGDPNTSLAPAPASTNPLRANDYTNYISFGLDNTSKFPTHYFRKKINIPNTADYSNYEFRFMRDDAIILFVNGVEVTRDNIEGVATTSPVPFSALAATTIDGAAETAWSTWQPLSTSLVQNGDNIIAVEIHQRGGYPISSSDMTFNLEIRATPNIPLAPIASSPANQTALLGLPFSYTVPAFTDPNGEVITYTASGFPSDFTFNGVTRVLKGTATASTGSPFSVTVTGTDTGDLSASAVFMLTINTPPDPTLVRGPYLQNASSTAMTLRWRTDVASQGVVRYGTSANALTSMVSETTTGIDHEVRLTGLNAQTQYFYSIGTSAVVLEGSSVNYFYTFPSEGTNKKVRIWSLGDFGIGSTRQTNTKNQMKNYIASQGDPYIDLFLWMGDNAYSEGTDTQFQNYVFNRDAAAAPWSYGYEKIMKQSPIFATPGNHDYGNGSTALRRSLAIPYYDIVTNPTQGEAGGVPSGSESYYSFNYGQIHFVSLDSDRYEDATSTERFVDTKPQIVWLKRDLAAAQANPNIKWIVAFWHHPPYTKGTHNSDTDSQLTDVRENLLPVLEQYKVDLVMNGHSHVYERSRLQKGNYGISTTYNPTIHNPEDGSNAKSSGRFDGSANSCYYFKSNSASGNEGTVYVVNGHGGASGGRQAAWPLANMASAYDESSGGSMYLEIEGGVLTAKMISGANGTVVDQFTIIKDADSFTVPASSVASKSATCECTDKADNKTHYTDASLNKLLTIQKNGQNIGTVGDGTFDLKVTGSGATNIAANTPTNYVSTPGGWAAMNRHFTLTPTTEPAAPVNVSFYYQQADVDAVNALITPDLLASQLYAFKMNNVPAGNVNPTSGHTNIPLAATYDADGAYIYKPGTSASATDWKHTILGNSNYQAETVAAKLSGGGGLGGPNPVTANTVPVATANANQTATVGTAFSYTVNTFADNETPTNLTYTARIDPSNGLTFDPVLRIIAGTPSLAGVSSVTITATDPGSLSASTTFTILVSPIPLTLSLTATPTTLLTTGTTTLSAMVSGGTMPYSYTFSGPGMIIPSGNTASVSTLSAGTQTFSVLVSDATSPTSQTALATVSVMVSAPNRVPVAPTVASQTATVGQAVSYTVPAFTDPENQTLTYTAMISPANGLVFDAATRVISGQPTTTGVSSVTVTATDPGSLSASTTFTITVNPVPNTAPMLANAISPQSATVGQAFSFVIPATTFADAETPNALTLTVTGLPAGLSFTAPATISGTPSTTVGSPTSITVTATDPGNLSASTSFTLTVSPAPVVNTAPTVANVVAPQSATVGQVYTLSVAGVFTDAQTPNQLTLSVSTLPQGLSLSGTTISGTPSVSGVSTITVTATDPGNLSASTSFTLTVSPAPVINTAPTVANVVAPQSATVGQVYTLSVAGVFTDAQTPNQLTLSVSTLPQGLSLSGTTISGTPSVSGVSTITVTATDPGNLSASTSFTLTVSPAPVVNTAPTVANAVGPQSATVGQVYTLSVAGVFTDAQTPNSLSLSVAGLPASLSLSGTTISGTPSTTVGSPYSVTVTATDPGNLSASTSFTLTVSPAPVVNTAPTVANAVGPQSATVGVGYTLSLANTFTDAQTPNSLSLSVAGLPASLSLSGTTISGTPSMTVGSPYSVTVTATDPGGLRGNTVFALSVSPVASVTSSAPFAITGVTTINCTPVANRINLSFNPQYTGLNGGQVSFSIVNEFPSTNEPGPYSLSLYTDNPVITLQAVQNGVVSNFVYNWLAACNGGTPTPGNTAPTVANSISPQSATVGQGFSYVIPANTFTDAQTPNALVLSVNGLPAGLNLTAPATITGTPLTSGVSNVTVTASDPGNLSASTLFTITVSPSSLTTTPTSPFAITGVTTIDCTPVSNRINLTFNPQYAGSNGTLISFSVANELSSTTNSGPYSISLYTDNPVITLRAVQSGVTSNFTYNWLAACNSLSTTPGGNTAPTVASAVGPQSATVGVGYTLSLANTFTDAQTPNALVLSAVGLPAGLSLTGTSISGTPSVSGGSTVTVTATDPGNLSTSATFTITVSPASVPGTPTGTFAITGVTTVICRVSAPGQRSVTFNPQYAGLSGMPISFSVVNELAATASPGPYTLSLYTDNPIINLRAVQNGVLGSYAYNWLVACNSISRMSAEPMAPLHLKVLGNPVREVVEVEVTGAAGGSLRLMLTDAQGRVVGDRSLEQASSTELLRFPVGQLPAGLLLLRATTPGQSHSIRVLKVE